MTDTLKAKQNYTFSSIFIAIIFSFFCHEDRRLIFERENQHGLEKLKQWRTSMFKNRASSMVLNKKHTLLPCSPKLTFEIKHGLHKTEKLLQPLNLTKDRQINKSLARFCLIMLSEIRLLKRDLCYFAKNILVEIHVHKRVK